MVSHLPPVGKTCVSDKVNHTLRHVAPATLMRLIKVSFDFKHFVKVSVKLVPKNIFIRAAAP